VNRISILPTLLTLGNAVCGFASIALASHVTLDGTDLKYDASCLSVAGALILAAMIFDALDGYAARLTRSASEFGGQLDSLCDAISFGLAPAFLLLRLRLQWPSPLVQQAIAVVAALYLVCAILRLARFNVENSPDPASHRRFKGLPSPGAAGCIAALALLTAALLRAEDQPGSAWLGLDAPTMRWVAAVWSALGGLTVALLMVSRLPYPHFNRLLRGRKSFALVEVVLVGCVIVLAPELSCFLLFWAFALVAPARYVVFRVMRLQEPLAAAPPPTTEAWRR
jgi:CDP-diacylglycerol---serine O-phosphatidyltransferase